MNLSEGRIVCPASTAPPAAHEQRPKVKHGLKHGMHRGFIALGFATPPSTSLREQAQQLFEPLEAVANPADTPARIELGRRLFMEPARSINRTQSCASCHPLDGAHAGMDNRTVSLGAEQQRGDSAAADSTK